MELRGVRGWSELIIIFFSFGLYAVTLKHTCLNSPADKSPLESTLQQINNAVKVEQKLSAYIAAIIASAPPSSNPTHKAALTPPIQDKDTPNKTDINHSNTTHLTQSKSTSSLHKSASAPALPISPARSPYSTVFDDGSPDASAFTTKNNNNNNKNEEDIDVALCKHDETSPPCTPRTPQHNSPPTPKHKVTPPSPADVRVEEEQNSLLLRDSSTLPRFGPRRRKTMVCCLFA